MRVLGAVLLLACSLSLDWAVQLRDTGSILQGSSKEDAVGDATLMAADDKEDGQGLEREHQKNKGDNSGDSNDGGCDGDEDDDGGCDRKRAPSQEAAGLIEENGKPQYELATAAAVKKDDGGGDGGGCDGDDDDDDGCDRKPVPSKEDVGLIEEKEIPEHELAAGAGVKKGAGTGGAAAGGGGGNDGGDDDDDDDDCGCDRADASCACGGRHKHGATLLSESNLSQKVKTTGMTEVRGDEEPSKGGSGDDDEDDDDCGCDRSNGPALLDGSKHKAGCPCTAARRGNKEHRAPQLDSVNAKVEMRLLQNQKNQIQIQEKDSSQSQSKSDPLPSGGPTYKVSAVGAAGLQDPITVGGAGVSTLVTPLAQLASKYIVASEASDPPPDQSSDAAQMPEVVKLKPVISKNIPEGEDKYLYLSALNAANKTEVEVEANMTGDLKSLVGKAQTFNDIAKLEADQDLAKQVAGR